MDSFSPESEKRLTLRVFLAEYLLINKVMWIKKTLLVFTLVGVRLKELKADKKTTSFPTMQLDSILRSSSHKQPKRIMSQMILM